MDWTSCCGVLGMLRSSPGGGSSGGIELEGEAEAVVGG